MSFIVGLTDFQPGGDHIAALRDPQALAVDMIENLDWVKRKLADSYPKYFRGAQNHQITGGSLSSSPSGSAARLYDPILRARDVGHGPSEYQVLCRRGHAA